MLKFQNRAHLSKVVSDVGDGAVVVIHWRDVDVRVPGDDPLGIEIVDEDFVDVSLEQDLAAFPGLIDDGPLIHLVGDGLPPCRGFFQHLVNPLSDVLLVLFWAFHLDIGDSVGFLLGFFRGRLGVF